MLGVVAPESSAEQTHEVPPPTTRDYVAVGIMAGFFVLSILLAMLVAPKYQAEGVRVVEDPESLANPFLYLGSVLVFTFIILLVAKFGAKWIIRALVLGAVLVSVAYVVAPFMFGALGENPAWFVGLGLGAILVALLYFYPEWYVVDGTGILVSAGIAAIFGVSFDLLPVLALLLIFAIYDAIAVYRTKHMLDLADSVLELRLPIMFVAPKHANYSFLKETRKIRPKDEAPVAGDGSSAAADAPAEDEEKRDAMFMGLGDAVIPGVLAVSSLIFLADDVPRVASVLGIQANWFVALATLAGSLVGFFALMRFVLKGNAQAGLPLLNGGAIAGFLLALIPLYGIGPLTAPLCGFLPALAGCG